MHTKSTLAIVSAACLGGIATLLIAAAPAADVEMHPSHPLAKAADADPNEMMQKWMAVNASRPAHEWLGHFVGEWDIEMSMWMDPGAPPTQSKGHASVSWKFPGKFIQEDFSSDFMGTPYKGFGMTGFDNNRNQFVSMWCDAMGTGMMQMTGSVDPEMKTMCLVGSMDEPMTGEMGKAVMYVVTIHSPDRHSAEMKEIIYGEPFTVMRIDYKRSQPAFDPHANRDN